MDEYMSTYKNIDYILPTGNRIEKRKHLISYFLEEDPGTGRDKKASRYQYNVERYGNYKIYLKRPTRLNKGFDFTVNIEGMYFKKNRKYSNPSHEDIIEALTCCKKKCPNEYNAIRKALTEIYKCNDTDLSQINAYFLDHNNIKHPIQVILLTIKWLFMEQDCAYWNYSGREMLFDELKKQGLA